MKRMYKSLVLDYDAYRMSRHMEGQRDGKVVSFPSFICSVVRYFGASLFCATFGHDLECLACDPESGSEDLHCSRCGWGDTIYFT